MNENRMLVAILALASISLGTPALAQQNGPISAERPGFSSSPGVLAPGSLQIESGYAYSRVDAAVDFRSHSLPSALLRYGATDRLEIQLTMPSYTWAEVGGVDFDGASDAAIGLKWQPNFFSDDLPVALFAGTSLPIGDDEFSSDELDLTLGAFWSWSSRLDWFGTILVSESEDDIQLSNAIGVSFSTGHRTSGYVEYFGTFESDSGPEHYLNTGLTYLQRNDLQLDAYLGFGLNDRSTDLFAGFGLAYRF